MNMTSTELRNEFNRIAEKDTKLDAGEKVALINRYFNLYEAVLIGMDEDMVQNAGQKIAGTLEYLTEMGKIQDDEDLWMLMNEIEKGA
jgi:hypothetical protein